MSEPVSEEDIEETDEEDGKDKAEKHGFWKGMGLILAGVVVGGVAGYFAKPYFSNSDSKAWLKPEIRIDIYSKSNLDLLQPEMKEIALKTLWGNEARGVLEIRAGVKPDYARVDVYRKTDKSRDLLGKIEPEKTETGLGVGHSPVYLPRDELNKEYEFVVLAESISSFRYNKHLLNDKELLDEIVSKYRKEMKGTRKRISGDINILQFYSVSHDGVDYVVHGLEALTENDANKAQIVWSRDILK
jgi:hypothetical protein